MWLRRDLRYIGAEASEQAVCFQAVMYAARSKKRYCAWVGFFPAAGEVIGAPSFEVALKSIRHGGRPPSDGYCRLSPREDGPLGTSRLRAFTSTSASFSSALIRAEAFSFPKPSRRTGMSPIKNVPLASAGRAFVVVVALIYLGD